MLAKRKPAFLPTSDGGALYGQVRIGKRRGRCGALVSTLAPVRRTGPQGRKPVQETVTAEGETGFWQEGEAQMAEFAASASDVDPSVGFVMSLAFSHAVGVNGRLQTTRALTWNLL